MSSENLAKLYKNAGKPEDLRRRRTETSVELRKQKGSEEMMKRRNLNVDFDEDSLTSGGSDTEAQAGVPAGTRPSPHKTLTLEEAVVVLQSNPTVEKARQAFESVRRALSRDKSPPIDKVIQLGFPFALVQALNFEDDKVKFEAAWCITNIVSGTSEQTLTMVKAGAIGPLLKMCTSPSLKMAEQALWCVANLAGDCIQLRDQLIAEGVLPILIGFTHRLDSLSTSFIRILVWTISNICRHKKPQVPLQVLAMLAPAIGKLVRYEDMQTQTDAAWALSYLTDGNDDHIALAMECLPDMVSFVSSARDGLIAPALRVLGNFVSGNDVQTQSVIDTGILSSTLPQLLIAKNTTLVKESCWLISNVLAGNTSQIQDVIDAQLLPIIFQILQYGEHRLQYEAGWAVSNLCCGGTANQILEICRLKHGLEAICACLKTKNNELTMNMLESLHTVLRTVSQNDPENLEKACDRVEKNDGLDHLEALQQHESEKIYSMAYQIIEEFFSEEEDEGLQLKDDEEPQNLKEEMFEF